MGTQHILAAIVRHTLPLCLLGACTSAPGTAASATAPAAAKMPSAAPNGLTFSSLLDLNQKPTVVTPQLRGGIVAVSVDWPASFYATFTTAEGTFACTAALVSSTALATAAHCVPENGAVQFKVGTKTYSAACVQHPDYKNNRDASADFGLCRVTPEFQAPAGFLYEQFDLAAMNSLIGGAVILTGYGCTSDIVGGGGADGKYRIGINSVAETSDSVSHSRGSPYYSPYERNNLFTAEGGANVCPGDSGGPAFRQVVGPRQGTYANRRIVGINSRVFLQPHPTDPQRQIYTSSMLSATGTVAFSVWATQWAKDNDVDVCGLWGEPGACR